MGIESFMLPAVRPSKIGFYIGVLSFWLTVPMTATGQCSLLEQGSITPADGALGDNFGISVGLDGDTAVIGAGLHDSPGGTNSGAAYVFVQQGDEWEQQAKLVAADAAANDRFGTSAAVDGNTLLVGAYLDDHSGGTDSGSAYIFVRTNGVWAQQAKLLSTGGAAGDQFGISTALDGNTAVVGAHGDDIPGKVNAGSAYVFVRSGTTWTQQAQLNAADSAALDAFGFAVAVSGNTAVVGAIFDDHPGKGSAGSAYVFVRAGTTWTQQAKLTATDAGGGDEMGVSADVFGDTAVIGAYRCNHSNLSDAGAAYVFLRTGTTWTQQAKLIAADAATDDWFGRSVSLDGNRALVGAPHIDDGPDPNSNVGAAYLFIQSGGAWTPAARLHNTAAGEMDSSGWSAALTGDTALVPATEGGLNVAFGPGRADVFQLTDCNTDGILDGCDLSADDCDDNVTPDECQLCGDFDVDGDVDGADFTVFLLSTDAGSGEPAFNPCADFDVDGIVADEDLETWLQCFRDSTDPPQTTIPPPADLGDLNGDGLIDGRDIPIMIDILTDPQHLTLRLQFVADLSGDGEVDSADVGPLVVALIE